MNLKDLERVFKYLDVDHIELMFKRDFLHLDGFFLLLVCLALLTFNLKRLEKPTFFNSYSRLLVGVSFSCFVAAVAGCIYSWGWDQALLALALPLGLLLGLYHPVNALCMFVALLLLRPWESMETNVLMLKMPRIVAGSAFFMWLVDTLKHRRFCFTWNWMLTLIALFSFWLLLSTFKREVPSLAREDYFETFFKCILVLLLIVNVVRDRLCLNAVSTTFVISSIGIAAKSIFYTHSIADAGDSERLGSIGTFGNANDLAALFVLIFPLIVVPLVLHKGITKKFLAPIFALPVLYMIWTSQSRGAFLGICIIFAVFFFMNTKVLWLKLAMPLIAGLMFVSLQFVLQRNEGDLSESTTSRITYIKTGLNMTARNPLLGVGFGGYPVNFQTFAVGTLLEFGFRTAHNSWVLAFAESGIIGGCLFALIYLVCLMKAWRVYQVFPQWLYTTIGYGVVITFLSHTYLMPLYVLFSLVVVAGRVADAEHQGRACTV